MHATSFSLPTVCTALKILTRPEATRSRVSESSTVPAYLQTFSYFYSQLAQEQEAPPFEGSMLYQVPTTSPFRRLAHRLIAALQSPDFLTPAQRSQVVGIVSQWATAPETDSAVAAVRVHSDCLFLKQILTYARNARGNSKPTNNG